MEKYRNKNLFLYVILGVIGFSYQAAALIWSYYYEKKLSFLPDFMIDLIIYLPLWALFAFIIVAAIKKRWVLAKGYSIGFLMPILLICLKIFVYDNFKPQIKIQYEDKKHKSIYIPKDLDDTHVQLDKMLTYFLKAEMKSMSIEKMGRNHFGIGMWIRNNWGLWADTRLSQYFKEKGLSHPDDMSGIILDSYWFYLHERSYDLDSAIAFYQNWWKLSNASWKEKLKEE